MIFFNNTKKLSRKTIQKSSIREINLLGKHNLEEWIRSEIGSSIKYKAESPINGKAE